MPVWWGVVVSITVSVIEHGPVGVIAMTDDTELAEQVILAMSCPMCKRYSRLECHDAKCPFGRKCLSRKLGCQCSCHD